MNAMPWALTAGMLSLVPLAGCFEEEFPGEPVGDFEIVGDLQSNGCGQAAVPALSPLTFPVEIRREGAIAYWRRHGFPVVSGVADGGDRQVAADSEDENFRPGTFEFSFSSTIVAYPGEPDLGIAGCALTMVEEIVVDVAQADTEAEAAEDDENEGNDAESDSAADVSENDASEDVTELPLRLDGDNVITLAPAPGSNCAALSVAQGGSFTSLPCSIEYTLAGDGIHSIFHEVPEPEEN